MQELEKYKVDENTNPHMAANAIYYLGKIYAKARSERTYLEEFRKSKKAMLIQESESGTIQAKESYAYAHKDYIELLEAIREAVNEEQKTYFYLKAAELRIEIWRTQQANARKELSASVL